MRRLFIAVPVIPEKELLDITAHLKSLFQHENIHWVIAANLHLTLKFLGDTPEDMILPIITALDDIIPDFTAAEGMLTGIGYFSQHGEPRIIYAELKGLPTLSGLAKEIQQAMEKLGFQPDLRQYKPHLTLARIKYIRSKQPFHNTIHALRDKEIQKIKTGEVILYESILRPSGPAYHPLHRWILPV
jgi:RNA 2',3'-cyclic 3'-phosphodiesterase